MWTNHNFVEYHIILILLFVYNKKTLDNDKCVMLHLCICLCYLNWAVTRINTNVLRRVSLNLSARHPQITIIMSWTLWWNWCRFICTDLIECLIVLQQFSSDLLAQWNIRTQWLGVVVAFFRTHSLLPGKFASKSQLTIPCHSYDNMSIASQWWFRWFEVNE